ncbi:uncharacterized protein VTP21DRAFT_5072 [Calcarisporiella thermophila]|uniref:uncharacterized protein n=1 Tax=Calcarisporiella thermophila TaxID=911321 RepID=UPI00374343D0
MESNILYPQDAISPLGYRVTSTVSREEARHSPSLSFSSDELDTSQPSFHDLENSLDIALYTEDVSRGRKPLALSPILSTIQEMTEISGTGSHSRSRKTIRNSSGASKTMSRMNESPREKSEKSNSDPGRSLRKTPFTRENETSTYDVSILGQMNFDKLDPSRGTLSQASVHSESSILGDLAGMVHGSPTTPAPTTTTRLAIRAGPKTLERAYNVTPLINMKDGGEVAKERMKYLSPGQYFARRSGPLGDLEGQCSPSKRPNFFSPLANKVVGPPVASKDINHTHHELEPPPSDCTSEKKNPFYQWNRKSNSFKATQEEKYVEKSTEKSRDTDKSKKSRSSLQRQGSGLSPSPSPISMTPPPLEHTVDLEGMNSPKQSSLLTPPISTPEPTFFTVRPRLLSIVVHRKPKYTSKAKWVETGIYFVVENSSDSVMHFNVKTPGEKLRDSFITMPSKGVLQPFCKAKIAVLVDIVRIKKKSGELDITRGQLHVDAVSSFGEETETIEMELINY